MAASAPMPTSDNVVQQGSFELLQRRTLAALAKWCATAFGMAFCIGCLFPAFSAGLIEA